RVAAVEAADRHDRQSGGELVAGRALRADRRRDPGVAAAVGLQQRLHLGADGGGVEQAAHAATPAAGGEAPLGAALRRSTGPGSALRRSTGCAAAAEAGESARRAAAGEAAEAAARES